MLGLGLGLTGVVGGEKFTNRESVLLDGSDEFINIDALQAALASDTKGTFLIVVKVVDASPSTQQSFISISDTDANERIWLYITASTGLLTMICVEAGTTQWTLDTDAQALSDATWAIVGGIMDGVEAKLKVNKTDPAQAFLVDTDKTKWMSALTGLDNGRIGDRHSNSSGESLHANGNFDEIHFWNIDLTDAEWDEAYDLIVAGKSLSRHSF